MQRRCISIVTTPILCDSLVTHGPHLSALEIKGL